MFMIVYKQNNRNCREKIYTPNQNQFLSVQALLGSH
jgi:hypothetical protein